MNEPIEHLVVGPDRHGVVRFGLALQESLEAAGGLVEVRRDLRPPHPERGVHVQFTDRLFGADARQAVTAVRALASRVHGGGARVTATLHDLPQPSDGSHYLVRAQAYADLAMALDGVVVSSEHERELLRDIGVRGEVTAIPLPIPSAPRCGPSAPAHRRSVAVFGFVYPGKGHAEVLDAMRHLPPDVAVMAIGEPSAGHGDLVDGLAAAAAAQHRDFVLTGHVPDDALLPLLRSVTVPVAHHRHVSASGSLNSWLTAARRPLAPSTRYTREIAARNPGALRLYDDDRECLAASLRAALDDPSSTWQPAGTAYSPTPDEAARCYGRFLADVHR